MSKSREARFCASGVPSSVSSRRTETTPASSMAARSAWHLWAITIRIYAAFSWHAMASLHPRTSTRMANASVEPLKARRPSPAATRLESRARIRSLTAMSPTTSRSAGTRPASTRRGRLTEAMERLKRARTASCLAVGLVSGLRKADNKMGIAPEAPMMGLLESNALRPRKLATIASDTNAELSDSIRFSILWTAPAFTTAALFLQSRPQHADQRRNHPEHRERLPRPGVVLREPPHLRRRLLPPILAGTVAVELQAAHDAPELLERLDLAPRLIVRRLVGAGVVGGLRPQQLREPLRAAGPGAAGLLLRRVEAGSTAGPTATTVKVGPASHGLEEPAAEEGGEEGQPEAEAGCIEARAFGHRGGDLGSVTSGEKGRRKRLGGQRGSVEKKPWIRTPRLPALNRVRIGVISRGNRRGVCSLTDGQSIVYSHL
ncbi:hypothetical protein MUK42_18732 [Musa troglodytarum]|uniref:Uncharacterized protein n=1 Tax=Musa troglodytarum TaxID=320322 RepID=A0A9E7FEG9_9LILI|nr:hypothetical protein MUK42_18732 [Musa troglodytarum]